MNLDPEDIADILQGIQDEGATCTWRTIELVMRDPEKPWLGTISTPVDYPVWISFVNSTVAAALIEQWRPGEEISSTSLFGLMGNWEFDPQGGDTVVRDGKPNLVVRRVDEAAPTGTPLFYVVEFDA